MPHGSAFGDVYEPKYAGFHGRSGPPVDLKRCRRKMFDSLYGNSQCDRKGRYEEDGMLWCGQHRPSAAKARDDARRARYAYEDAIRDRRYALDRLQAGVVKLALEYADAMEAFGSGVPQSELASDRLLEKTWELQRLRATALPEPPPGYAGKGVRR